MPPLASSSHCRQTFADQHIHGIAGVDFATSAIADIHKALDLLAQRRTTRVTASIPSVQLSTLSPLLDRLRAVRQRISGVHLEGPYLAPQYAGAHSPDALLDPTSGQGQAFLQTVIDHQHATGMVSMMTVAPELPGFTNLVQQLVSVGIRPALGHTAATALEMQDGIDTIYRLTNQPVTITHLYNAMRGFHHRSPGPLLPILEAAAEGKVRVELIGDGHHVDRAVVRWWLATYPDAVQLVSDASAATLPPNTAPLTLATPNLGPTRLAYPTATGPRLADNRTLASGGGDLLSTHDKLVAAGIDHDRICSAMTRDHSNRH